MEINRIEPTDSFDQKKAKEIFEEVKRQICDRYHVRDFVELTPAQQNEVLDAMGVPPHAREPS